MPFLRSLLHRLPALLAALAGAFVLVAAPAEAAARAKEDPAPRAETYLCPHTTALGVDCFLEAVEHLYTMCRQVKSIEIIEYGYEHAEEGVNGAKSEYCVDKHKGSIARPLQAALKEASGSRSAVDALRGLHDLWLRALADLKWHPPETDEDYKGRVGQAYDAFRERATLVRTAMAERASTVRSASGAKPAAAAGRAAR